MSDKSKEESVTESAEVAKPTEAEKKCCSGSCRPHTSLYLSVIAILLAGYAAIAAGKNPAVPADAEARLSGLESSIQGLSDQIASLGKDVESNRDNLIKNQLKKALLNIQEVSGLAQNEAKATIAEVEKLLSGLTSPATIPVAEPEAAAVEKPAAESAPAETPAEDSPEAPIAETPSEQPEAQAF